MSNFNSVESRAENILVKMINDESLDDITPRSRLEELLIMLNDSIKNAKEEPQDTGGTVLYLTLRHDSIFGFKADRNGSFLSTYQVLEFARDARTVVDISSINAVSGNYNFQPVNGGVKLITHYNGDRFYFTFGSIGKNGPTIYLVLVQPYTINGAVQNGEYSLYIRSI